MGYSYQETITAWQNSAAAYCSPDSLTSQGAHAWVASQTGTAGAAQSAAINGSETNVIAVLFGSPANDPNLTNWAAGTWTVRLNVTTADANVTWTHLYICRVNSAGVSQATVGSNTAVGLAMSLGVKTASVTGTAQTAATSDVWVAVCSFTNAVGTPESFAYTPNQLIDTPLGAVAAATTGQILYGYGSN